jgi:hypothetical protein
MAGTTQVEQEGPVDPPIEAGFAVTLAVGLLTLVVSSGAALAALAGTFGVFWLVR